MHTHHSLYCANSPYFYLGIDLVFLLTRGGGRPFTRSALGTGAGTSSPGISDCRTHDTASAEGACRPLRHKGLSGAYHVIWDNLILASP